MHTADDLVAVTERDGIVDCRHYGSAVIVDSDGKVIWSFGNAERPVFERSTTKPFRALALLRAGCAETFCLDEADVALVAGSHSGTAAHVARAAALLVKTGISQGQVQCGTRLPLGEDALMDLGLDGNPVGVLHCDCSGEHIGALALCRRLAYPTDNYLDETHPLQELFAATLRDFGASDELVSSIDRCGMPTSAVRLSSVAVRVARLMRARHEDEDIAHLIGAILRNPMIYTGKNRIIGELILRSGGTIFGKCGAEGLYTIAWPCGLALALKIGDGNPRAAVPLIERAAAAVGLRVPSLGDCVNDGAFAAVRTYEPLAAQSGELSS